MDLLKLVVELSSTVPPADASLDLQFEYYSDALLGPEDAVQCFSCGGSLKNWLATDRPWSEHVRWFPHCAFLQKESSSNSQSVSLH